MRITETKLRRIIRSVLQESLGPNPWAGKLRKEWDGRFPGGSFDITVADLAYWSKSLGVESKHPLNPANGQKFTEFR